MSVLVRVLAWAAITAYLALLVALAAHGLLQRLDAVASLLLLAALLACALLLKLRWPLQLAALLGALAWHWPWFLALLFVAPRCLTCLPGWINWVVARRRHPPPRWASAPVGAEMQP
jgi:hypothetical protein